MDTSYKMSKEPISVTVRTMKNEEALALVKKYQVGGPGRTSRFEAIRERVKLEHEQGSFDNGQSLVFEIQKLPNGKTDEREVSAAYTSLAGWMKKIGLPLYVGASRINSLLVVMKKGA
jgi:hypothetical protein